MANEKLYVASMPIKILGVNTGEQHSFIIYDPNTDSDNNPITFFSGGESLILRAGVDALGPTGTNVVVEAGVKFTESKDEDYRNLTLADQNLVALSLPVGQTATSLFNTMVAQTQAMGVPTTITTDPSQNYQTNIDYFLDDRFVCHSYTSSILAMNGIDLANNLPVNQFTGNTLSLSDYKFSNTAIISGSGTVVFDTFSRIKTIIDTGSGNTTIVLNVANLPAGGVTLISDNLAATIDKLILKGIDPSDIKFRSYNDGDLWVYGSYGQVIAKLNGQLTSNNKFNSIDVQMPDGTTVNVPLPQIRSDLPIPYSNMPDNTPRPWEIPDPVAQPTGMQQGNGGVQFPAGNGGGAEPLILDLNGDGAKSTRLGYGAGSISTTYFDMDNDGFAERTAWVASGDGLLVMDKNGNGKIDNQTELFGNTATYANGFLNLKQYDSNSDNKMTSADAQWNTLRVWVDADGDAVTDAGELKTLSSLNITQINLNATTLTNTFDNENEVGATGTFVMNGQTRQVNDVWFRVDQTSSRYMADVTLDVRTLFLPTLKGFGNLKDLHVAMSEDSTLLTMMQNFVSTTTTLSSFSNEAALNTSIQNMLFKWAGVDTIPSDATTQGLNTQTMLFLERITGYRTSLLNNVPPDQNVSWQASSTQAIMLSNIIQDLKGQLLVQTFGSQLFENANYNLATGDYSSNPILSSAGLALITSDLSGIANSYAKYPYWNALTTFLLNLKPISEYTQSEIDGLNTIWSQYQPYAGTWHSYATSSFGQLGWSFNGSDLSDYLVGIDDGSNLIWGNGGDDTIIGGNATNWLFGGDGNDTITLGTSGDWIEGGDGNDTYIIKFNNSEIRDTLGYDTIQYGIGFNKNQFSTRHGLTNYDDMEILFNGQLATTVKNFYSNSTANIEKITFFDGSYIELDKIVNILNGTSGNDSLSGHGGLDQLNGGKGNDTLLGGVGNDTYVFNVGDGIDSIYERSGTDTVLMGAGITASNIRFEKSGHDLNIF